MKNKIIEAGVELILATEGYSIRIDDLDDVLENQLIAVVEKHCELLKATNHFLKLYLNP
jgi:septum formation inhibitor-activating ATPase MinD